MNTMAFNPDAAAKKRQESFDPLALFGAWKFDAAIPEMWRSLAETTVDETRLAFERASATLETSLQAMERSYDAAGHAASALNRKIVDIAERNVDSSFDLARSLATAKNLAEIVELQGAFWRKQFETLLVQAEEVRDLSAQATSEMAEPIAKHARGQAEAVQALSKKMTAEAANAIKRQTAKLEEDLRRAG